MSIYSLHQVKHTYGKRTVLQVDDLAIESGEIFALVGPSGAGKSTIARLLFRFYDPQDGNIQPGQVVNFCFIKNILNFSVG